MLLITTPCSQTGRSLHKLLMMTLFGILHWNAPNYAVAQDYSKMMVIPSDFSIYNMVAHPFENLVYCIDQSNYAIRTFDTDLGQFVQYQPILARGYYMWDDLTELTAMRNIGQKLLISPLADKLYVCSPWDRMIEVYSLPDLTLIDIWTYDSNLFLLGMGQAGIIVAGSREGVLFLLDGDTGAILHYDPGFVAIHNIAVHPDGNRMIGLQTFMNQHPDDLIIEWEFDATGIRQTANHGSSSSGGGGCFYCVPFVMNWEQETLFVPTSLTTSHIFGYNLDSSTHVPAFTSVNGFVHDPAFFAYNSVRNAVATYIAASQNYGEFTIYDATSGEVIASQVLNSVFTAACMTNNGKVFFTWHDNHTATSDKQQHIGLWGDYRLSPKTGNENDLHVFGITTVEVGATFQDDNVLNPGEELALAFHAVDFSCPASDIEKLVLRFSDETIHFAESGTNVLELVPDADYHYSDILFFVPVDVGIQESVTLGIESVHSDGTFLSSSAELLIAQLDPLTASTFDLYQLDMIADHSREYFYLVDARSGTVMAIDAKLNQVTASALLAEMEEFVMVPPWDRMKMVQSPDGNDLYCIDRTRERKIIQRFSLPDLEPTGLLRLPQRTISAMVSPDNALYVRSSEPSYSTSTADTFHDARRIDMGDGLAKNVMTINNPGVVRDTIYFWQSRDGQTVYMQNDYEDVVRYEYDPSTSKYLFQRNYHGEYFLRGTSLVDSKRDKLLSFTDMASGDPDPWINAIHVLDKETGSLEAKFNGNEFRDTTGRLLSPKAATIHEPTDTLYALDLGSTSGYRAQISISDLESRKVVARYTNQVTGGYNLAPRIAVTPSGIMACTFNDKIWTSGGISQDLSQMQPLPALEITNEPIAVVGDNISLQLIAHGHSGETETEWTLLEAPAGSILDISGGDQPVLPIKVPGRYRVQAAMLVNGKRIYDDLLIHAYAAKPSVALSAPQTDVDFSRERLQINLALSEPLDFMIEVDLQLQGPIQFIYPATSRRGYIIVQPGETEFTLLSDEGERYASGWYASSGTEKSVEVFINPHWFLDTSQSAITVSGTSPPRRYYDDWRDYYFTRYSVSLPRDEDYDKDGNSNLVEFTYGLDPFSKDTYTPITWRFAYRDGMPTPYLLLPYVTADGYAPTPTVMESHDLINWVNNDVWNRPTPTPAEQAEGFLSKYERIFPLSNNEDLFFQFQMIPVE